MKIKKLLLSLFMVSTSLYGSNEFRFKETKSSIFVHETKIEYVVNQTIAGHIYYLRIPLSIYIIHTFFVLPQFRGKGYGKKLLNYTAAYFKSLGARSLFIQPGPYDIHDGEFSNIVHGPERELKLHKLIELYKSAGFKNVSWFIATLSKCIYYFAQIDENPSCLMVQ